MLEWWLRGRRTSLTGAGVTAGKLIFSVLIAIENWVVFEFISLKAFKRWGEGVWLICCYRNKFINETVRWFMMHTVQIYELTEKINKISQERWKERWLQAGPQEVKPVWAISLFVRVSPLTQQGFFSVPVSSSFSLSSILFHCLCFNMRVILSLG